MTTTNFTQLDPAIEERVSAIEARLADLREQVRRIEAQMDNVLFSDAEYETYAARHEAYYGDERPLLSIRRYYEKCAALDRANAEIAHIIKGDGDVPDGLMALTADLEAELVV